MAQHLSPRRWARATVRELEAERAAEISYRAGLERQTHVPADAVAASVARQTELEALLLARAHRPDA